MTGDRPSLLIYDLVNPNKTPLGVMPSFNASPNDGKLFKPDSNMITYTDNVLKLLQDKIDNHKEYQEKFKKYLEKQQESVIVANQNKKGKVR